jgi:hypothetical protein
MDVSLSRFATLCPRQGFERRRRRSAADLRKKIASRVHSDAHAE